MEVLPLGAKKSYIFSMEFSYQHFFVSKKKASTLCLKQPVLLQYLHIEHLWFSSPFGTQIEWVSFPPFLPISLSPTLSSQIRRTMGQTFLVELSLLLLRSFSLFAPFVGKATQRALSKKGYCLSLSLRHPHPHFLRREAGRRV